MRLAKEFRSPVVEGLERLLARNVMHQNAGICSTIKSHTKALESFLSRSVPDLAQQVLKKGKEVELDQRLREDHAIETPHWPA